MEPKKLIDPDSIDWMDITRERGLEFMALKSEVDRLPEAVVRCAKCMYREGNDDRYIYCGWWHGKITRHDGYCWAGVEGDPSVRKGPTNE